MSGRITDGFRDIIELDWTDFRALEQEPSITNFDAVICSLVRACVKGNLRAIQMALDRLDGKIASEIEVEYPKFYTLYPNATTTKDDPAIIEGDDPHTIKLEAGVMTVPADDGRITLSGAADLDELAVETEELPTGSLRAVLEKMLESPKEIVDRILGTAGAIDKGEDTPANVYVKSVIVAGLMKLVHDGRISAVFEVLDQIDGKVADKVKLLGNDVYLTRYDLIAPAGAEKNADGVYQIAANNTTDTWAARLGMGNGGR